MLPGFATDTITTEEPTWVDQRGKKVATYPGPGREVDGCSVQAATSTTDRANRDSATWELTALLPPEATVSRLAKITFEGDEYQIQGRPNRWKSPTGAVSHTELHLIAWEG